VVAAGLAAPMPSTEVLGTEFKETANV
jgi:hypothetical protein